MKSDTSARTSARTANWPIARAGDKKTITVCTVVVKAEDREDPRSVALPNSPAGRRAQAFFEAASSGKVVSDGYHSQVAEEMVPFMPAPRDISARLTFPILSVVEDTPHTIFVVSRSSKNLKFVVDFRVQEEPPHLVSWIQIHEVPEGGASGTAIGCAIRRAEHRYLDDDPKIFDDWLAERLVGERGRQRIEVSKTRSPAIGAPVRTNVVTRSLFAEDRLLSAIERGVTQYIILGAGLDSFAFRRRDLLKELNVFEVDRPESQAWKRNQLRNEGIEEPPGLAFVPVNFERQNFEEELGNAGFDKSRPAFVSWLGVTHYLTRQAIGATLRTIASWSRGTEVVMDHMIPEEMWGEWDKRILNIRLYAVLGEAFLGLMSEEQVRSLLETAGFSEVEQLGPEEIRARFLKGRNDSLKPWGISRLVRAVV